MGLDMYLYVKKKNKDLDVSNIAWGEENAYWRKANQVHKYLCDNGEVIREDTEYIVSKQVLVNLLEICKKIKEIAVMKKGPIENGKTLQGGKWVSNIEEGEYIENVGEIEALLPTQDGFFFGSTYYDKWYMEDIDLTIEQLEPIINNLKDDEETLYYASW